LKLENIRKNSDYFYSCECVRKSVCIISEFIINEEVAVTVKMVEAPTYHNENNDVAVKASVK
jgi:hypothetical protein